MRGSTMHSSLTHVLDTLATIQVPHGLFLHFYVASVLSSAFWGVQILTKGAAFHRISQYSGVDPGRSMSIDQVILTWSLMLIQGIRRLSESILFARSSASKMWFIHWLLGIAFYVSFGIALWIEGLPALCSVDSVLESVTWSAPSLKSIIGIPIFILASGLQHDCHAYLASLPKYTLPIHPIFQVIISPHYFAECMIYLSLAIIAAPPGTLVNATISTALIFVGTNLSVTASNSKDWYGQRYGIDAVKDRWIIFPLLY